MGIYMNQVKRKYKAFREERLMAFLQKTFKTQSEIEAALNELRGPRAYKTMDASPLTKGQIDGLKKLKHANSWREIEELLDFKRGSGAQSLARLAFRYFKNLK